MKIFLLLFLTLQKWFIIKNIMTNQQSTEIIKNNAKKIIFMEYYNWTRKQTFIFIKNNPKILKKIKFNELNMYALSGLSKAIHKYNYSYTSKFSNYALLYIKNDLYQGITDLTSLKLLPHSYRVSRKWKLNNTYLYKKSMTKIQFLGDDDWILDKFSKQNDDSNMDNINEIKNIINNLNPFLKRIFYYRFDENMNKRFRINKIAILMCVSDETIRKSLNIIRKKIKDNLSNFSKIKYHILHNDPF